MKGYTIARIKNAACPECGETTTKEGCIGKLLIINLSIPYKEAAACCKCGHEYNCVWIAATQGIGATYEGTGWFDIDSLDIAEDEVFSDLKLALQVLESTELTSY